MFIREGWANRRPANTRLMAAPVVRTTPVMPAATDHSSGRTIAKKCAGNGSLHRHGKAAVRHLDTTGRGREILPNMNASIPHDSRRACARMACGSRLCGERRRASPGPTGWQNRTSFGDREQPSSRSGAARDMENTGLRFSVATPSRFGLARNLFGDYIGSGKHSTGCCRI